MVTQTGGEKVGIGSDTHLLLTSQLSFDRQRFVNARVTQDEALVIWLISSLGI
jgi:hypothetical protein